MKAELGKDVVKKDVVEKDVGDVGSRGSFVARVENYPLQKTMGYHNQNRVKAMEDQKVSDQIHEDLLERAGTFGRDRGKWGVEGVCVDLIGLTHGTAGDKLLNSGHAGPPVILLE